MKGAIPAVSAAAAVAVGVWSGSHAAPHAPQLTVAALLAGLAALAILRLSGRARDATVTAMVALALAGAADAAWRDRAAESRLLPRLARDHADVRVCGTVVELGPRSVVLSSREVSGDGVRFAVREPVRLTLATERDERASQARPGPARGNRGSLRAGELVCARGTLRSGTDGRPPLMVAQRAERRGIGSPLRLAAGTVRDRFARAAVRALPERQAGLLLGMTEGDTTLLDDETMDSFRTTGLAHLVAVSGSNVAVVLGVLVGGVRLVVRRGRALRVALALPGLLFFAFLTALEPSVLRAVVTAGLVLVVGASGRTADGMRAAAVSFIVLVLVSPELLTRPGFQLSYAATIGLVLWAGPLADRVAVVLAAPRPPGRIAVACGTALGTTLAAQFAVAPLLVMHFGRIPAVGAVANLLVAPLAPVVMVGGGLALAVASLSGWFWWAPATLRLVLDAILGIAGVFSSLPGASVALDAGGAVALLCGVAAVALRSGLHRWLAMGLAVVAAATSCGHSIALGRAPCGEAEVRVLDVGQGTAVLLRSGGANVLVDGGPQEGRVVEKLRSAGVSHIDVAVISHPHADHTEGLAAVLQAMPVGQLVGPLTMPWGTGAALVKAARRAGVPVSVLEAGASFELSPRLAVDVVGPEAGDEPPESEGLVNPYNLVLRARVADTTVLLPGDLDTEGQDAAIESGRTLTADVLIAPHHGSADFDPAFVQAVDPHLTVVTVGAHNRYGHPTPEAMSVYGTYGPVLRTDHDGEVVMCTNGGALEAKAEKR